MFPIKNAKLKSWFSKLVLQILIYIFISAYSYIIACKQTNSIKIAKKDNFYLSLFLFLFVLLNQEIKFSKTNKKMMNYCPLLDNKNIIFKISH